MGRVETQGKASLRRKRASEMREVKRGIRRLEKLMRAVSDFQNAIKLMICEIPNMQGAILVLGASPLRPQHVYELCFWHGESVPSNAHGFTKTKAAEVLSKKVLSAIPASTLVHNLTWGLHPNANLWGFFRRLFEHWSQRVLGLVLILVGRKASLYWSG